MTYTAIDSDTDDFGDRMTFISEYDRFWIENFSDCRLNKKEMAKFLKKCLNFVEGSQ